MKLNNPDTLLYKIPAYASPSQVNMFQINYKVNPKGVGGDLGIFWVGMCRLGLQIGTLF